MGAWWIPLARYATAQDGYVERAGDADSVYSSRHVILRDTHDTGPNPKYLVHLHLDSVDVIQGANVIQGQKIGEVGDDSASYPHLHFEVRDSVNQTDSVHPLSYMAYSDTVNLTTPADGRFNHFSGLMSARLLFEAPDRNEGDLLRVEVDLLNSAGSVTATRIVDFNNSTTFEQENRDECAYVNDIAIEGYQKSNMQGAGRDDAKYGIVVRNLPAGVTQLQAQVIDVGGNMVQSAQVAIPNQMANDDMADFETWPPAGWTVVSNNSGPAQDCSRQHAGSCSMLSTDNNPSSKAPSAIEVALAPNRYEWLAEGWFYPTGFKLSGGSLNLLYFLSDNANVNVAARIRQIGGDWRADLIAREGSSWLPSADSETIQLDQWTKWRLHLMRLGTRESTAVLYLGDPPQYVAWRNWDSSQYPPTVFRAGIGRTSFDSATATVWTDDVRLSEQTSSAMLACTP